MAAVTARRPLLIIACGALAREVQWVLRTNEFNGVDLTCLPAELHNTPTKIPATLRKKIETSRNGYDRIIVLFGDCGTGGEIDAVCTEYGIDRIEGPHCYAFYTGIDAFSDMHADAIGTFYLTDYLVRFFDRLIIDGLGLDRYPELRDVYFANYTRLVYLAQTEDPDLKTAAKAAAERLDLAFEYRFTGLGELGTFISQHATNGEPRDASRDRLLA